MASAELLIGAVLLGLGAGAVAALIRALPWPKALLGKKPLGCPTCMGWWTCIAMFLPVWILGPEWFRLDGVFAIPLHQLFIQFLAAAAVATWVNAQVIPPPLPDFDFDTEKRDG